MPTIEEGQFRVLSITGIKLQIFNIHIGRFYDVQLKSVILRSSEHAFNRWIEIK